MLLLPDVELDFLRGTGYQPVYFPKPGDDRRLAGNRRSLGAYGPGQRIGDSERSLNRINIPKRDIRRWLMALKYR